VKNFIRAKPILAVAIGFVIFRLSDLVVFWWVGNNTGRSLFKILMSWDSGWYLSAANNGYPEQDAIGSSDEPVQTTWAWPPLYWLTARAVSYPLQALIFEPIGLGSGALSVSLILVNIICALLATLVLYLALLPLIGMKGSVTVALLWAAGPASPVFLMAYAEGLMSLLVFAALWAVVRGHWVSASFFLLGAAFVKSSSPPFALALIIAVWIAHFSGNGSSVSRTRALVTTVIAGLASVAWPLTVGLVFGSFNALAQVQQAWGRTSIPFRDTLAALYVGPGNFPAQWIFSVSVVVIVTLSGFLIFRDRRYPWFLRLSGIFLPAFVIAVGANIAAPRLLIPDLSLPVFEKKFVRGLGSLLFIMLVLLVIRSLWIYLFPGGSAGQPAP
jgi:hypothetical protein